MNCKGLALPIIKPWGAGAPKHSQVTHASHLSAPADAMMPGTPADVVMPSGASLWQAPSTLPQSQGPEVWRLLWDSNLVSRLLPTHFAAAGILL